MPFLSNYISLRWETIAEVENSEEIKPRTICNKFVKKFDVLCIITGSDTVTKYFIQSADPFPLAVAKKKGYLIFESEQTWSASLVILTNTQQSVRLFFSLKRSF